MLGLRDEFASKDIPFKLPTVKDWLRENATIDSTYCPGIPECEEVYCEGGKVTRVDSYGKSKELAIRSLQPYVDRAKSPPS